MKRLKKIHFFTILVTCIFLLIGCERDDICAESTPTTPKAIITFFDVANPQTPKSVTNLRIIGEGEPEPLSTVNIITSDSIAIPLRTNAMETRYIFYKNYEEDADGNITGGNPDTVIITYATEQIYVSRACGFKTVFKNYLVEAEDDGDNWILTSLRAEDITNIENENQAHINIRH